MTNTDLIESRISEIRETIAAASPGPWYFTLVEASEGNVCISHEHWDLWRQELEPEVLRSEPGVLEAKLEPRCVNVACVIAESPDMHLIANSRAFLEALLAEREGMKAEIARLTKLNLGEGETWLTVEQEENRDLVGSLQILESFTGTAEGKKHHARKVRAMFARLRGELARRSAPLDPSSAPSETPGYSTCPTCGAKEYEMSHPVPSEGTLDGRVAELYDKAAAEEREAWRRAERDSRPASEGGGE
jgi:hypothetical protein